MQEKFKVPKIPTPTTFSSILDETLPFAAPLVNLFQPQLFPRVVDGQVKKSFKDRYAEALLSKGDDDVRTLEKKYPDFMAELKKAELTGISRDKQD
jgi:hypothetical protein